MDLLAFLALGFLIGNVVGLTAESVGSVLIPVVFTFGGGSAVALAAKLDPDARKVAYRSVLAVSSSCLVGIYVSVAISEYQFLTPLKSRAERLQGPPADRKYLRSASIEDAHRIDQLRAQDLLTTVEAYEQMYLLVQKDCRL